jgi:hypothetical protein
MSLKFKEPYYPNLKGEYEKDEETLRIEIERLAVIKHFEGWLNYTFKRIDDEGIVTLREDEGTGFLEKKLTLSEERKQFVTKGMLWNDIEATFNDIKHFLPLFHMKYKSPYSFRMAKTYAYCFLFLRGVLDIKGLSELSLDSKGLDLETLKTNSIRKLDELNQQLLNLLQDLNYSYKDFEEALLTEYEESKKSPPQNLQTFNLINEDKFRDNFEAIYSRLVPIYLNESTTKEDVKLLFSGGKKVISNPIRWMQNPNQLNYFVSKLKHRDKISNGRFYKIAQDLFVNRNRDTFTKLKDNHTIPENYHRLNIIVDLF